MRSSAAVVLGVSVLAASSAHAQSLDVEAWLRKPGVKLVAVELYARWCKPCIEAVPRWKALHEKYRDDGLRLVVISTQDPGGILVNPGWSPDEIIADDQGTLARALGAGDALPAAFLWSWDGKLLVAKGSIDDVERRIEGWMRSTPRVDVDVRDLSTGTGVRAEELRDLVRERLRDDDKLHVVATKEERAALDRIKAESFGARFDERMQCELGRELPANSLLEARVSGSGPQSTLSLVLLSAEKGCLVAASSVPWSAKKVKVSVAEAVDGLVAKLRTGLELPGVAHAEARARADAEARAKADAEARAKA
ncbi:redoxin domain-containing protein, partial [Myxococcota bacterium]|nr:redoxin domain-containing protein [Myxococcota bacterium]